MFGDASEEATNEVEASLRALLLVCRSGGTALLDNHHDMHEFNCSQFEETKARAAETEAAAAKERMLNIEKTKLRDIVAHAFSPLVGRTRQH